MATSRPTPSDPQPVASDTRIVNLPLPAEVPTEHPEAARIAFEWSAIFTPFLIFGAFALYRYLKRKASADRQDELQSPHFWPRNSSRRN